MISICLKMTVEQSGPHMRVKSTFLKPHGRNPSALEKEAIIKVAYAANAAVEHARPCLARHLRDFALAEGATP